MTLSTKGSFVTEGAVICGSLLVFLSVPFGRVVFSVVGTWWCTFVAFIAITSLVAAAANLGAIHRGFTVLYGKPLRVRHFNPVTLLTTIATVTGNTAPVGWFELFAVLLQKLGSVVGRLDIFKPVAALAKFHQRRFQHPWNRTVVGVMASGTF